MLTEDLTEDSKSRASRRNSLPDVSQPFSNSNEEDKLPGNVSFVSLSTLSDRSDLNENQIQQFIQQNYMRKKLKWDNLSISERARLFNKWAIISLVGNLFTVFGSIFYIFDKSFKFYTIEIFIGFGALLTWISIVRYLANTKQYTIINRTFMQAIPTLSKVALGIMPIFVGFALLGMCLFWPFTEKFNSLSSSIMILFCVQNGDSIHDLFIGTMQYRFLVGFIFTFVFTFFAYSFINNLYLVIVQDSYLTIKY